MRTREELRAAAARVIADGAVPLRKLAALVPAEREGRRGRLSHVSTETIARWIAHGRKGVFLDGARLAGRGWYSSAAALARFAAELAAAERGEEGPASPTDRERRAAAAMEEFDRLAGGGRA